jgi:hypothetical protein
MKISTLAVVIAVPVTLIQAQSPLSGLAQGVVIHDTASGVRSLMKKAAGDKSPVAFATVHGQAPTYTTEALLHHLVDPTGSAQHLQMNAISTGNDNLPIEAGPYSGNQPIYWEVASGGMSGWAAIALSVSETGAQSIPGTVFAARLAMPGPGIGSDLFSYWFDTNINLPSDLIDAAHLDLGREHFNAGQNSDVAALDTYMPAVVESRGIQTHMVPIVNRWFFALTPASATHIKDNANWGTFSAAFGCTQQEIGSNYVYTAQWTPAAGWSSISVEFDPARLGLNAGDAIDAIAFFDVPNYRDRIVFSLSAATSGTREQILVGGDEVLGQNPGNKPLRVKGGARITEKVGIANDTDIDAVCTYDPEHPSQAYGQWIALPVENTTADDIGCSVARYRVYDNNGFTIGEQLLLQATGLPNETAAVGWIVTIDGQSPVIIREVRTGERMETVMSLPPGVEGVTVSAVYASRTQTLYSWDVRLLRQ